MELTMLGALLLIAVVRLWWTVTNGDWLGDRKYKYSDDITWQELVVKTILAGALVAGVVWLTQYWRVI